jgi:hypothetical protein
MASEQSSSGSIVPRLMATIKRLTPAELRDFKRRFTAWQQASGEQADEETALIQACQARLPAANERRLSAAFCHHQFVLACVRGIYTNWLIAKLSQISDRIVMSDLAVAAHLQSTRN